MTGERICTAFLKRKRVDEHSGKEVSNFMIPVSYSSHGFGWAGKLELVKLHGLGVLLSYFLLHAGLFIIRVPPRGRLCDCIFT